MARDAIVVLAWMGAAAHLIVVVLAILTELRIASSIQLAAGVTGELGSPARRPSLKTAPARRLGTAID